MMRGAASLIIRNLARSMGPPPLGKTPSQSVDDPLEEESTRGGGVPPAYTTALAELTEGLHRRAARTFLHLIPAPRRISKPILRLLLILVLLIAPICTARNCATLPTLPAQSLRLPLPL